MLKFIIPAILFFLIVLFWEKINEYFEKKFQIKISNIAVIFIFIILLIVLIFIFLIYYEKSFQ